jgi:hypothetical protein
MYVLRLRERSWELIRSAKLVWWLLAAKKGASCDSHPWVRGMGPFEFLLLISERRFQIRDATRPEKAEKDKKRLAKGKMPEMNLELNTRIQRLQSFLRHHTSVLCKTVTFLFLRVDAVWLTSCIPYHSEMCAAA